MTIFEFLTVAVSIILALGLSKLVSSVPFVFDSKKRDWLHILTFLVLVFSHILLWWHIWLLNGATDWDILKFTLMMASPLSLYLAAISLTSHDPSQVDSWKQHFADQSGWFFQAWQQS